MDNLYSDESETCSDVNEDIDSSYTVIGGRIGQMM